MRVIAGKYKSHALTAPQGADTRPTSDRVRESLFATLGMLGMIDGARVLDLFAGSGALGIEALSRGASDVVFVEKAHRAVATVKKNLAAVGGKAPGCAGGCDRARGDRGVRPDPGRPSIPPGRNQHHADAHPGRSVAQGRLVAHRGGTVRALAATGSAGDSKPV